MRQPWHVIFCRHTCLVYPLCEDIHTPHSHVLNTYTLLQFASASYIFAKYTSLRCMHTPIATLHYYDARTYPLCLYVLTRNTRALCAHTLRQGIHTYFYVYVPIHWSCCLVLITYLGTRVTRSAIFMRSLCLTTSQARFCRYIEILLRSMNRTASCILPPNDT
jgi:hypothetical protein